MYQAFIGAHLRLYELYSKLHNGVYKDYRGDHYTGFSGDARRLDYGSYIFHKVVHT